MISNQNSEIHGTEITRNYIHFTRVPEPHERAKDDMDYEPVPPPQSEGIYPNSAAFVTSQR